MAKTFLYTTDNSTAFIVVAGKDEAAAQAIAEQAVTALPGVALRGCTEINHSLIVNLSITMLTKAKSDDILLRRLTEKFKDREFKLELENEPNPNNGSLRKKILVNGRPEILLDLKNREQITDFEENGLGDDYMEILYKRLEGILRRSAVKPEIIVAAPPTAGNNGEETEKEDYARENRNPPYDSSEATR
jgi:hypothetical protein